MKQIIMPTSAGNVTVLLTVPCNKCEGRGVMTFIPGSMAQPPCEACNGAGQIITPSGKAILDLIQHKNLFRD